IFLSESQEYLNLISGCLVKLEGNPGDLESLNEIFRCTHTLKGMSATMGYDLIAQLSHQMENLFDELRGQRKTVTSEIIDTLFAAVDILEESIQDIKLKTESKINIAPCIEALKKFLTEETPPLKRKAVLSMVDAAEFTGNDLERFQEAQDAGNTIFKITLILAETCVMKEARAFLILTNLKKLGEIVFAFPSIEELKEAKFDRSFMIVLAGKENKETIHETLLNISEVEEANIAVMEIKAPAAGVAAPQQPTAEGHSLKKIQSIRIPVQRLDRIMNFMGELAIAKIRLLQVVQTSKIKQLEEIAFTLDHLTAALQDEIMQTRLLPVAYILDNFTRVVRDLARKKQKEVELEISGSEIELDRVVLDEIGDPLIHLLRNAIDHGIESPEERKAKGKNAKGKIHINVARQKGQISIEVADDGRGVDFEVVRRLAIERGVLSEQEASGLEQKRILDILTMPGFSTAKEITDTSGRGVGLDVVKIKMETLGGRLDFETKPGKGTKFFLTIPLTLAIIKAMLVKVHNEILAVPLMNIRETIKVLPGELKFLQNFEVIRVREEVIPVLRMEKELNIPACSEDEGRASKQLSLVIVEFEKKALALLVSRIIGEQDIVVKPLPAFVKKTKGIAGATILGDGKVALILDIMGLR
ncbi:MAG TPA: chemotaxis protein CheA, partial [Candidatus Omnitrophota bacterium]|nr:chemotaxis protein CheA [Candidatus Omnitrophota bacterium]